MGHVPAASRGFAADSGVGLHIQDCCLYLAEIEPQKPTWFYGLGYWTRGNAEICLLAKRGQPKRRSKSVHQFIISPIEEHSKKPDITREKIIELAGDLPRVELFARQKTPGWDAWGNEVDSDVSLSVSETR